MDGNTNSDRSLHLQQVLRTESWTDLAECFDNLSPTFCADPKWDRHSEGPGVSGPDMILANSATLPLCVSFQIRRDLTTKGHLGLEVKVRRSRCMIPRQVYVPPTAFPIDEFEPNYR